EQIVTDSSWISTTGSIRYSEFYHGEVIDKSIGQQKYAPVKTTDYPKDQLIGQICEPVRITQRIPVREVLHTPSGKIILDFGQNFAGVAEARLHCPKGTKITLRHGEMLDENGELFTANLRTAKAQDTFICSGNDDIFRPEFTFHGFRYIEVDGLDDVDPGQFTGCVMHTDYRRQGSFSCSDDRVTKLWQNVDWTMRSNYMDVPMDCPQRDERLGYTGDAQIFLPAALFHGNLALFFRKWLGDLKIEQTDAFGVPLTVPDILRTHVCVSIWHDAAAVVPWQIYQTYGDLRVLSDQYDSIRGCVEYSRRTAGKGLLLLPENSSQFGDWVALDAPKGPFRKPDGGEMKPSMDEKGGGTDSHLIGNVYYLNSIDILAKSAALLGKTEDAEEYRTLYENVLNAFRREYITPSGRLVSETQTAAALILYFGLAEEKDRPGILSRLQMNLIKNKKHLLTGFVGTEYLPHVLSRNNLHSLAGDILMKDDCPSWLYEVNLGATTVWELWDGVNPDGSINPFAMNSFNQYGFATISDWMTKELAGLKPAGPGYCRSRIEPRLVRGIEEVSAAYETPYGRLSCDYSCRNGRIRARIEIPANTEAEVILPGKKENLPSGIYEYDYETDLSFAAGKYSDDSILRDLLKQPAAKEYFESVMPELAHDPLVNNFAGRMSICEIRAVLPETMVPKKAYPVFDEMIRILNNREDTDALS
ncbi:MAG: glycoside hydrolase family 78 protein, partial [Solobacterium sp.]|nr:glycoside hydrolase family 78 protein [Solobacterium sp.]